MDTASSPASTKSTPGFLGQLLSALFSHWFLLAASFLVLRAFKRRYFSPVSDVPAISFLATISRLGKVRDVLSGHIEQTQLEAHRKYGSIVRIGPNEVSISDPAAIPIIYDKEQRFEKTDFYSIFGFPTPAHHNTFSETNPAEHRRLKRNVASAYSMSTLVGFEQFVDSTVTLFLKRIRELSLSPSTPLEKRGEPVNMVKWFQWFAFDAIGEISFSRRFGFLDKKEDIGGTCKLLEFFIAYTSAVAMIPETHKWLLGNPILPYIATPPASIIADMAKEEIEYREAHPESAHSDIVSKIMENQARAGNEQFPQHEIFNHASVNVSAGSELSGIAVSAMLYQLVKHPAVYAKLEAEIDTAAAAGNLSDPPRYRETNYDAMPYLAACIKESLRFHPAVGITLARHVPKGGATICGRFFPGGTRVGISPYVVGRDRKLYGEDANVFRPERWLECSKEKCIEMENGSLGFSQGARVCIGRHIALMEICKVFPALMRHFRFELARPEKVFRIKNYTFMKPEAVEVWIFRRNWGGG
ncbi:cytochrome P450 [Lepidopterella palustris CBS 459.81]|uniref:Cytochrome P450 n=1 Tax=Lepidopterella palustris CBS 459.81 TaxID=1314670 RepID=A0A8E2DZB3_9PEZI|nr:cytochrome P450 [Lepidopterella palustris CBS 459.81]